MFGFEKHPKAPAGPPALTSQELMLRFMELEMRIASCEQAVMEICFAMRGHLDRIDHNLMQLDKNMHNLAAMTLRPPKDLLGGGNEPN